MIEYLYKRCQRGAGFYKYKVTNVFKITEDTFILHLRGTHWRDKKQTPVSLRVTKDTVKNSRLWYNTVPDFFLDTLAHPILARRKLINSKQFQRELKQIKTKYPEEFL